MTMRWMCLLSLLLAAGCGRFRYPCQDPANWSQPQCQRPQCAVTGTCPDQLLRAEEMKPDEGRP